MCPCASVCSGVLAGRRRGWHPAVRGGARGHSGAVSLERHPSHRAEQDGQASQQQVRKTVRLDVTEY